MLPTPAVTTGNGYSQKNDVTRCKLNLPPDLIFGIENEIIFYSRMIQSRRGVSDCSGKHPN
jgi:hypothetical protein